MTPSPDTLYMILEHNEDQAKATCGCILKADGSTVELHFCPMHDHAEAMCAALAKIADGEITLAVGAADRFQRIAQDALKAIS